MKLLLDTNIFLEIILDQERASEAKKLLLRLISTISTFLITLFIQLGFCCSDVTNTKCFKSL